MDLSLSQSRRQTNIFARSIYCQNGPKANGGGRQERKKNEKEIGIKVQLGRARSAKAPDECE